MFDGIISFFQWIVSIAVIFVGVYFLGPYVWDFIKEYKRIFIYGFIILFVIPFVISIFSFVIYHFVVGISLGFGPFLNFSTVNLILKGFIAIIILFVGKVLYSLFSK